jgi:uncharacterized protein (DUF885 family)
MADEAFDALMKEVFHTLMERNPILATHMGIHDWDQEMPVGTLEHQLEEIALFKDYRAKVEAIDSSALSPVKRIEWDATVANFNVILYKAEEIAQWRSIPEAPDGVGDAVFPLFTRDFAPMEERMEAIISRLAKSPKYIEETRSRLTDPVKLWAEISAESCQRIPMFLEVIKATGREVLEEDAFGRLEEAAAKTSESITAYGEWLADEVAPKGSDEYILGEERFRKLIELRGLGLTVEEIRDLGLRYREEAKAELRRLAERIKPGATVEEVKEAIKSNHPADFEAAQEAYRRAMADARQFVVDHDLATVPSNEKLDVIETPAWLRHLIPFAAYLTPGPFDEVQYGVYMVTPPEDETMWKEHNYASIMNTSVHEAYPGHHLQLSCANQNPSYARMLIRATETIEGWAHFCEDMMKEQGFDTSDESRFIQMIDVAWRAARIIIDVDLHTGKMSFDEAVGYLREETGMEEAGAVAEVKRYTMYPGYQLSYMIGKHLIKELREEVREKMGEAYTDKGFHDTILYAGSLRVDSLRRLFALEAA